MPRFSKPSRVLVIEDNLAFANAYRNILNAHGFEVRISNDGQNGIYQARIFAPDIIILDLLMPQIDGYEVLKIIQNDPDIHTQIIVLSNLDKSNYMRRAFELGAIEFFGKFNSPPDKVVAHVEHLLNKK